MKNRIEILLEPGQSKTVSFIIVNDMTLQKQLEKEWCFNQNIKLIARKKEDKYIKKGHPVFNFVI